MERPIISNVRLINKLKMLFEAEKKKKDFIVKNFIKLIIETPKYSHLNKKEIHEVVGTTRQNVSKYYDMFHSGVIDNSRGLIDQDYVEMDKILEKNHKYNTPLTKEDTKTELANIIRKRNPNYTEPCVSDTLYYKYFNHDKNIRLLKGSIRSDARTNVNSDQVVQWPKDQQDFLINNKVPLERIWNIDETAIKLDETAVKVK
ncbi:hypothetical protein ACTFIY_011323 [Dictyostelium cf. discoideum]